MRKHQGGNIYMLTALDETLNHQVALPFSLVGSTDHEFYNRNWYGVYSPDMTIGMITGLGLYNNVGVFDGYASVQRNRVQMNQRWSRDLYPNVTELAVGGLRHEVVEPLKHIHLSLKKGEYPVSFELDWVATGRPRMESPHLARGPLGHPLTDYVRYHQGAKVKGWFDIKGERIQARDWPAARDASWGKRGGHGGAVILRAPAVQGPFGLFWWIHFLAGNTYGYVHEQKDGNGNQKYLDGYIAYLDKPDQPDIRIVEIEKEFEFGHGDRGPSIGLFNSPLYTKGRMKMIDENGKVWEIEINPTPNLAPWAYAGTGYFLGYNDGGPYGAYRGVVEEWDTYDMTKDIHTPINTAAGKEVPPGHREQPVNVVLNGVHGHGHTMLACKDREIAQG